MNKIKSVILMSILSMLMVISMVGCGNNPVVGTWELTGAVVNDKVVDVKEVLPEGFEISFEFKKDGTFSGMAMDEKTDGTWKEEKGKIIATVEGESAEFTLKDGKLHLEIEGSEVVLEKK